MYLSAISTKILPNSPLSSPQEKLRGVQHKYYFMSMVSFTEDSDAKRTYREDKNFVSQTVLVMTDSQQVGYTSV